MATPIIQARDVHKNFNGTMILNGLDLNVFKGSVIGLLGHNGAGKTTLIKLILGLLKIKSGEIRVFDEDPWKLSDQVKERIGYVPQSERLYPWLTVKQLVFYVASFYQHWNMELVEKLIAEWRIDPKARIGILSEGQAQKVSILLALGHEPELLILDEPVASLDPLARRQFLKMILDLVTDRECTVLFSTHITSDLERVADHVAILNEGVISFSGELEELKDKVKRLRIIGAVLSPQDIGSDGLIHYEKTGDDTIVTVRDFCPEMQERLSHQLGVDIQVEDLNLEEIFLEMSR